MVGKLVKIRSKYLKSLAVQETVLLHLFKNRDRGLKLLGGVSLLSLSRNVYSSIEERRIVPIVKELD